MKLHIAVCDDEGIICKQLEKLLLEISREKELELSIDSFSSSKELCKKLKQKTYDLLFLDIELPQMNGVQVGNYIRETLKDEMIQIAYISSKQEYAMELFEYRPINFLVKPLTKDMIQKVIDKYLMISEQKINYFQYKKKRNTIRVPLSEIQYFESNLRQIKIVTIDHQDIFYGSIKMIMSQLNHSRFVKIHKSIIVNYNHIRNISYEEVEMLNHEKLPISQALRSSVREIFATFMEEE